MNFGFSILLSQLQSLLGLPIVWQSPPRISSWILEPNCGISRQYPKFCRLANGQRYFVYSLLQYFVDFCAQIPLFRRGPVGGCYMLTPDLHTDKRRFVSSIWKNLPETSGVFTYQVLDAIIPDIPAGELDGYDCWDIDVENVQVFIDVCAFLIDYSASSEVLGVVPHSARAPFSQWSFSHRREEEKSKYWYTTGTNFSRCSYTRSSEQTFEPLSSSISCYDVKLFGTTQEHHQEINDIQTWPLLLLSA